jgi:hypothetical protein
MPFVQPKILATGAARSEAVRTKTEASNRQTQHYFTPEAELSLSANNHSDSRNKSQLLQIDHDFVID